MSSGLVAGRKPARIARSTQAGGKNALFAAELLDGASLVRRTYEHCTFANVSFKDVDLDQCSFVNCAFIDCYFRETRFLNSALTACKFIDCGFTKPEFVGCTLKFLEFRGCFIPYSDFCTALPPDPGFRYRMADELARESAAGGSLRDARSYRLAGEAAFERHTWNLAWASGGAYYEKRRPALDRVKHGGAWVGRKFNRLLWSYGERGWILARSFVVVAAAFAGLFALLPAGSLRSEDRDVDGLADLALFSLDNLLNAPGFSGIDAQSDVARWVVGAEVLIGLMFIGLFVSLVFNWIKRR